MPVFGRLDSVIRYRDLGRRVAPPRAGRDRLGKKPLYWAVRGGTVWSGSSPGPPSPPAPWSATSIRSASPPISRNDAVPTPRSIFTDAEARAGLRDVVARGRVEILASGD